ncbi:MAG: hypothetical protein FJW30_30460 [Acidobacteria bacterium]|nr:hypothetical protein [Acidobacteriota bacterium]
MKSTLLFLLATATLSAVTITLNPASGNLTALPGQTVGWGFTVDSPTNYFVPTAVNFVPASGDGVFADMLGPRLTVFVAGPAPDENPNVTEAFDVGLGTGLASFTVNGGVALGTVIAGNILIDYDLFSVSPSNPSFDPGAHYLGAGTTISLDTSILVDNASTSEIPEPSAALLLAGGLLFAGLRMRRG